MPYYTYEAKAKNGKVVKSDVSAMNRQELINNLHNQGMTIISIKESGGAVQIKQGKMHKRTKSVDLILFAKQFSILLENGVDIIDALDVMLRQMQSADLVNSIKAVKKDIESGSSLKDALSKHPRIFSGLWRDLVEAGEISGQLPFVMKQIVLFLESRENLRKKIANAMIYPAVILVVAAVVILVFTFKIVPVFQDLFKSFGAQLPPFTQAVIDVSSFMKKYFIIIAAAVIAAAIFFKRAISTKLGRRIFELFMLKMPVVGSLMLYVAIEKFSTTLAVLLKSGIPITRSLEISGKTSEVSVFADRMEEVKVKVIAGQSLSESLQQTNFFPPIVVQLILVGEKTGNFSGMLDEVGKFYSDIIDGAVTRLTALIEPAILVVMTIVVGTLLIAMFLPIFKLTTVAG